MYLDIGLLNALIIADSISDVKGYSNVGCGSIGLGMEHLYEFSIMKIMDHFILLRDLSKQQRL